MKPHMEAVGASKRLWERLRWDAVELALALLLITKTLEASDPFEIFDALENLPNKPKQMFDNFRKWARGDYEDQIRSGGGGGGRARRVRRAVGPSGLRLLDRVRRLRVVHLDLRQHWVPLYHFDWH